MNGLPPQAPAMKKKSDLTTIFKTTATPLGELDLSNKSNWFPINYSLDLSDMHAAELTKCFKSHSGHVKSLSLAKNRLTDDGIG